MGRTAPGESDLRVELAVSRILRAGLLLAAALVVAGEALYLARHGAETPHYGMFDGEPDTLTSVAAVARVAFSALAFAFQRDRLYTGVTLFVLAVLAYSLLGGLTP